MYSNGNDTLRKIITFFLALICAGQLYANPPASKDLKQLQNRIKALQKDLASKETSKTEAADALRESERTISKTNRILVTLAQQLSAANISLDQLLEQSKQIQSEIKMQQEQLGKMLYYQYINGQQDYMQLLLKQQDPNQIARNLHYYGYLKRARSENINTLRAQLEQLDILTRESHTKREEIVKIQSEQIKKKQQLEQEKMKREEILANLSEEISQQQREINKLKSDEQRLSKLVKEINKLLSQKKPTPQKSTPPATNKSSQPSLHNNLLPDSTASGRSFESLKGQLRLPVRGELVNRFDSPRQEGGIKWKGLFIRSQNGKEVKAIASGQVVFADWLRGFGNLMILDHGNNYMSLYGYNEAIYKRVGDRVRSGDTIATVGNSGGHRESGLYFELRHQGKPFDPLTWMIIE
ncbi:murein hydrolase activator EnvC family protein [Nitrosomonas communis]|uniref:Septal ring factor EnvC, activator of murein hydrolases AmiA and AmiB n=1 Tax=Nitrosomonas communis TaxID=44574 RepID=A0A1I4RYE3_9PROT|nr:peptidoglycan DD-metalloendopeptidase family protein [Nitrosomonas communis]SFM57249.1 Septal ring factor EnvC, activator of murein hydrolases AmiA and AmiB [Nitrosomonas communis]